MKKTILFLGIIISTLSAAQINCQYFKTVSLDNRGNNVYKYDARFSSIDATLKTSENKVVGHIGSSDIVCGMMNVDKNKVLHLMCFDKDTTEILYINYVTNGQVGGSQGSFLVSQYKNNTLVLKCQEK